MAKGSKAYNMKTFLKGQTIFKEGDPGNLAYLIRSGTVDIYKVMNNKKILLERLNPGEIFGEMSIISKEPRSAHAIANEYTELVVINQKDLEVSINKSLPIVQALANLLIKRLRHTSEMIREHPTNNIFLSICNMLHLLHENLSVPNKKGESSLLTESKEHIIYSEACHVLKETLSLTQVEIDGMMQYLLELGLIEVKQVKIAPMVFKKILLIPEAEKFIERTKEYAKDWKPEKGSFIQDLEFIDISEFSRMIGNSPDDVVKKVSAKKIPIDLFYLHKAAAIAWVDSQDNATNADES
ncbi:transcriptional regulator, Crp/Fnr family [Candidatus Magnetomorum sp. HK-1]|nr:transcriptional regulator, Crp/Fnr family [Candidatus Magnetomorum sp. HK-1]